MSLGPNFVVAGAAKSGTTSLCHYLRQHPDVFVARQKESHYFLYPGAAPQCTGPGDPEEFNALVISDEARYLSCFARAGSAKARGEASVYYMYDAASLERALAYDASMKVVLVLRDPTERAFSAWSHKMRDGKEPEHDFRQAVLDEPRRAELGWSPGFRYESVGRYASQVEALHRVVPADQLHVLLYDDLVGTPERALQALFRFLDVAEQVPVDSSLVMNASGTPRLARLNALLTQPSPIKEGLKKVLPYRLVSSASQQVRNWNLRAVQMDDADARWLRARYADDVDRLGVLLDRDLTDWQTGAGAASARSGASPD